MRRRCGAEAGGGRLGPSSGGGGSRVTFRRLRLLVAALPLLPAVSVAPRPPPVGASGGEFGCGGSCGTTALPVASPSMAASTASSRARASSASASAAATPAAPAAISLEFGGLEHELPSSISSFLSATSSPSPPASSDSASLPEEEEDVVQETTEDAELADEQHQAEENEDTEDTEAMLAVEAVELNIAPAVAARVVTAPTMVAVHNDSFLVCPLGAAPAKPNPPQRHPSGLAAAATGLHP